MDERPSSSPRGRMEPVPGGTRNRPSGSERTFPAVPGSLSEVRRFIAERAEGVGFTSEATTDLILAVSEAVANSVRHSGSDEVHVRWESSRGGAEVQVRDDGVFRLRAPMSDEQVRGGRGLPLMLALVDECVIRPGTRRGPGTVVYLVKQGPRPAIALVG